MEFKDRTLKCRDCGKDFTFTAGEQEFFAQKGFDRDPIRCQDCRKAKKQKHKTESTFKPQEEVGQYTIVCKGCKKEVEVPFKPKFPDDVYCAECFEKNK